MYWPMSDYVLTTARLRLEPFAPAHGDGLHVLDRDPEVMRYLTGGVPRTRAQTDESIIRVQARWAEHGYAWWSVFRRDTDDLIGAACVQNLAHVPGAPLEIGWRLRPGDQGHGYATEAGRAAMRFAFERVGVDYLVAVADLGNHASTRVMDRLGMRHVGIQTHYDQPCIVYELHRRDAPKA